MKAAKPSGLLFCKPQIRIAVTPATGVSFGAEKREDRLRGAAEDGAPCKARRLRRREAVLRETPPPPPSSTPRGIHNYRCGEQGGAGGEGQRAFISATVASSIRLLKPHSLSYQLLTFTRRPDTLVSVASNTEEWASWLKSTDTSGSSL